MSKWVNNKILLADAEDTVLMPFLRAFTRDSDGDLIEYMACTYAEAERLDLTIQHGENDQNGLSPKEVLQIAELLNSKTIEEK